MFIPVPIGSLRVAIVEATKELNATLASDRAALSEKSYTQLHAGAVHNGLKPSQAQLDQMREMSDRDVSHMMEGHPALAVIDHLTTMNDMIAFYPEGEHEDAIIDDHDFGVLRKHLSVPGEAPKE